jgi:hypothetical protein
MKRGLLTGKTMQRDISGESPSILLTCGETETICGSVCRFVTSLTGEVNGFMLDREVRVCFPADVADGVMEMLSVGSRVLVDGCVRVSHFGDGYLDATTITSLDSRKSVKFDRTALPQASAMPSVTSAPRRDEASPAPPDEWPASEIRKEAEPLPNRAAQASDFGYATNQSLPPYAIRSAEDFPTCADPPGTEASRETAVEGIDQALKSLHRTEVLLAYLLVVNAKGPHAGYHLFEEALHTYQQALSRTDVRDFAGAEQFAAASGFLSHAAEILILRTMPRNSDHGNCATSCQEPIAAVNTATIAQDQLQRVEGLLLRIRLLVNSTTALTTDCAQIQKLVLRGGTLYGQARCFCYDGRIEDAIELAHAAEAVARSAEHLYEANCLTRARMRADDRHFT